MTETITLTGVVATTPRLLQTTAGLSIASFRLASGQRRFDRSKNEWVDADTNWYTVNAFRQLADNAGASLGKGDRVVVSGRLRIRSWESGERSGTTVEVDADSLGHDLFWGRSTFSRSVALRATGAQDASAAEIVEGASPPAAVTPGVGIAVAPVLPPVQAVDGSDDPGREAVAAGGGDWHGGEDEPPF